MKLNILFLLLISSTLQAGEGTKRSCCEILSCFNPIPCCNFVVNDCCTNNCPEGNFCEGCCYLPNKQCISNRNLFLSPTARAQYDANIAKQKEDSKLPKYPCCMPLTITTPRFKEHQDPLGYPHDPCCMDCNCKRVVELNYPKSCGAPSFCDTCEYTLSGRFCFPSFYDDDDDDSVACYGPCLIPTLFVMIGVIAERACFCAGETCCIPAGCCYSECKRIHLFH